MHHSNDKRIQKIMSSGYHMGKKIFIEASYINSIHTWEIFFAAVIFECVCRFYSYKVKTICMSLICISRQRKTKWIPFMRSKFNFPYVNSLMFLPIIVVNANIIFGYNYGAPLMKLLTLIKFCVSVLVWKIWMTLS